MGLDSVELLMLVEDKFGIQIEDSEAEKICTVQDFSNSVYSKILSYPTDKCLIQLFFRKIKKALQSLDLTRDEVKLESKISDLLPQSELKVNWKRLEDKLELKLPELVSLDFNPKLDSYVLILGIRTIKRNSPVTKGTIKQLIDWIISLNFEQIIDSKKIANKYEVERVISGMINKKMGIPINEIELKHSIHRDLGVD